MPLQKVNLFYAAADIAIIRTSIKNDYSIWFLIDTFIITYK